MFCLVAKICWHSDGRPNLPPGAGRVNARPAAAKIAIFVRMVCAGIALCDSAALPGWAARLKAPVALSLPAGFPGLLVAPAYRP